MASASLRAQLERLLAEHEPIVKAIHLVLGLLDGHATTKTAARAPDVLAQALALDRARTATKTRGRPKKRAFDHETVKQRRQRSADLLAKFNTATPVVPNYIGKGKGSHGGLSILVQHGYLKKKGDGYIRTSKEFIP